MKQRIIAIGTVGIMVLGMLTGCSGSAPEPQPSTVEESDAQTEQTEVPADSGTDKDIVIAGIYKSGDQQWFIGEGAAAEEKAKEMGASEFMYIDVKLRLYLVKIY